ncbi:hypothetical protein [Pleionea litopenaei]|uniref:Uncharacterized protein n=1 Tax=Pleionea litopenaei TaxID=3070815 RepID=A0AA51RTJ4_9GAMM|nr:hypothetical protein [Pleionea sp. HL-JVS1]WMS87393.1 hypothetical protein Q9312_00335 [Pleionea sp. HL-JVS1]
MSKFDPTAMDGGSALRRRNELTPTAMDGGSALRRRERINACQICRTLGVLFAINQSPHRRPVSLWHTFHPWK